MKGVITLVSVAVLGTVLITGTLHAQGTPQSVTEKRVDVVQLALHSGGQVVLLRIGHIDINFLVADRNFAGGAGFFLTSGREQ